MQAEILESFWELGVHGVTFSGEEHWRAFFHQLGFVLGGFESTRFMNEACVIPVLLFGSENGEPVLEKFSC